MALWIEVKRQLAIKAFCVAMLGVGINQLIGMTWQHPRPFMVGIGHTFIPHAADSSFPSDHATVLFGTSLTLLFTCAIRSGLALLLIGLCVAWARLFLGVHFPFDMLGAAAVACVALMIVNPVWKAFGADIVVIVEKAYRTALRKPIALGWLRR